MHTDRRDGAPAPGQISAANENARRQPGVEEQSKADSRDCAETRRQRIETAQARAAMLGLELVALDDDAWRLSFAALGRPGRVVKLPSLVAAEFALQGFADARVELRELVYRMRGAA